MEASAPNTELMRRALAIACAALDEPESGRRRWALVQCGDDRTLRDEVASLLAADGMSAPAFERRAEEPMDDPWPGRLVGRYRVGTRIGSGGMGTVYRAEPETGVTRQPVALKLIKRGMDSEEILKRFLREREILARLEHVHIARLIDGGLTEDDRPWFALELVTGEALIDYCDRRQLDLHARVDLYLQVCDAVAYAHRNLVVHRDLKPGNVLVTADGQVKLLDFGIAKLIDADGEAVTRSMLAMMTPEYAAPEQYDRGAITTQTDVYLLGLMLAELLTGRRPASPQRREAGESDVSAHLDAPFATRGAAADLELIEIATRRSTTVPALARALRGDLDRICRRAMSYSPERRYRSASALGDDLRRYRSGAAVEAMNDALGYRMQKFLRRHRVFVSAVLGVMLALVIGAAMSWREAQRLRIAERQSETTLELLEEVFLGADPYLAKGGDTLASELLERARARLQQAPDLPPALAARLWSKIVSAQVSLDDTAGARLALAQTISAAERALACKGLECVGPDAATTRLLLISARARLAHFALLDDPASSEQQTLETAIAELRTLGAPARSQLAEAVQLLSDIEFNRGEYTRLDELSAEVVALNRAHFGDFSHGTIMALGNRASLLRASGRYPEALVAAAEAYALCNAMPEMGDGTRLYAEQQYAGALSDSGQPGKAAPLLLRARDLARRLRGQDGALAAGLSWDLAGAYSELGEYERAIAELRPLLSALGEERGANVAAVHNALGNALSGDGDGKAAAAEFKRALEMLCPGAIDNPPCLAISLNLADADIAQGAQKSARQRLDAIAPALVAAGGRGLMRWHLLDSRLQLAAGDAATALRALAASEAALEGAEVDPIDQAHWRRQRAAIHDALGEDTAAREQFKQAAELYRSRWTGRPVALKEVEAMK